MDEEIKKILDELRKVTSTRDLENWRRANAKSVKDMEAKGAK